MSNITIEPRKTVATRYFSLREHVPNPHRDRRCRYGLRGVSIFKTGTVVRATEYEQGFTLEGVRNVERTTEYSVARVGVVPQDLAKEFAKFDTGEARPASTLEEAAVEEGVSVACLCEYAVRQLLADGVVTIESVLKSYRDAPVE